jgi:hypothetical protein
MALRRNMVATPARLAAALALLEVAVANNLNSYKGMAVRTVLEYKWFEWCQMDPGK